MKKDETKKSGGFTLAELLTALSVSGIVLGAVVSLAFALGKTNEISEGLIRQQAQLRYTTIRLSRLVRYSKLVCGTPGGSLVIWVNDTNDEDKINPTELVYIETGTDCNYVDLLEFEATGAAALQRITVDEIQNGSARTWLFANCTPRYIRLLTECTDFAFTLDTPAPDTGLVNFTFRIDENDVLQTYQVTAALFDRAANLLDSADDIVNIDDD